MDRKGVLGALAGLSISLAIGLGSVTAHAMAVVDTFSDDTSVNGNCSLREAVLAVETSAPVDACAGGGGINTINIPAGVFVLNGPIDITRNISLQGAGAGQTVIDGNGADRIFKISGISVSLYGMTLKNGNSATNGGAIYYQAPGQLMIWDCALTNNAAASGGAVYFEGNFLELYSASVTDNAATSKGGGLLLKLTDGTVKITNTTIGLNKATTDGGGIAIYGSGNVSLTNDTISGNAAGSAAGISNSGPSINFGGGSHTVSANVSIKNTIVSDNAGGNCGGSLIASAGNNIEDDHTCGFSGPGDHQDQDPMLGPLQNNDGKSATFALLPSSSAVDSGDAAACPADDQRRLGRPADGNGDGAAACDIGAFELNAVLGSGSAPSSEPVPTSDSSAPPSDVSVQPVQVPVCGNGKKEGIEQCDDANRVNGDGCSATCRFEIAKKPNVQVQPKKWYDRLLFWK